MNRCSFSILKIRAYGVLKYYILFGETGDKILALSLNKKMVGALPKPGVYHFLLKKTYRHDITEILLKVALNTIPLTPLILTL